ncbi:MULTISPECIES: SPOR domain-containing protein, partial [unclassified Brevundimonas]|uniref:SPOR domain-containing protein n=1 Tax=unclassified Brevundimonas TaxID=2622653 RepID=UPI0025C638F9
TPAPSAARTAARTPTRNAEPQGRWSVQVGAFREEAVARNWLNDVNRRFRSEIGNARQDIQTANGWYRSRFTGLTEDKAKAACEALAARRVTCMVVQPS